MKALVHGSSSKSFGREAEAVQTSTGNYLRGDQDHPQAGTRTQR